MKVAAIVPAYNEERTIGRVVRTLKASRLIDEVIVVSDGSVDKTAQIAQDLGANVVELKANIGKGGAMKIGTQNTDADACLFIDADLVGLNQTHIADLLHPIIVNCAEMSIGVFADGRLATDLAQKICPFLSGQRAVKRNFFDQVPELEHSRFGVEMALSRYAEKNHTLVATVELHNLSQVMKEEKRGLLRGFYSRLKMYWEIIRIEKM